MEKDTQRMKYLAKNTAIFTIGNFATKIISFFLVPLYTNTLSTSEYGTIDLVSTVCGVLAPVLMINISESVMRFALDKEADHNKIMSVGLLIYGCSLIFALMIFPINAWFDQTAHYSRYIYLYTVSSAGSQLFLSFLRGKEMLAAYTLGNVLQSFSLASLNILLLLRFHLGVNGYFIAMILSAFITMAYAAIAGKVWNVLFHLNVKLDLLAQMAKYSVVLIPNTFMWWIMNASDRIMVTAMVGAAANGIYAISYKLPSLVSTFTGIFNQAWSYSAIKEEGASDEAEYNNRVFRAVISMAMLVGIGIITITKPFLKIYVEQSYFSAWKYVPFLTIGCVYLTLGTFIATSYTVHKDSFGFLFSATFGAFFNVILNYILIPAIGVYGAAIATCLSYVLVFTFRFFHTRKYLRYDVLNKEFIFGTVLLAITSVAIYIDNAFGVAVQWLIAAITIAFYSKIWLPLLLKLLKRKKG